MSILSFLTHVLFVGQSLVDPNLPALVEGALRASGATDVSVQVQGVDGTAPAVDMLVLTDASLAGGKERIFITIRKVRSMRARRLAAASRVNDTANILSGVNPSASA